jgi:hypothetical protein
MLLQLPCLLAAVASSPKCTPNPGCAPQPPTDPEPGCKTCVDASSSYNCAACCPGYTLEHSGTVSYCTKAPPPPPAAHPPIATSFTALQRDNCGGGFVACTGDNVTSHTTFAIDSDAMLLRRGPTDLLPAAENQVVVWDYGRALQTVMWVDTTTTTAGGATAAAAGAPQPPRLINCTRFAFGRPLTPADVAASFVGYFYKAHELGNASSGLCEGCQQWQWVNQGSLPCPPPQNGSSSVREPETWTLGPALSSKAPNGSKAPGSRAPAVYPLHTLDNRVWSKACGVPARYMWASSDWQTDFTAPAPSSAFAVPPDAQCPPPSCAEMGVVALPPLLMRTPFAHGATGSE